MMHAFVVIGTRPEAIKLAPVIHALRAHEAAPRVTICATGQHRELLSEALHDCELSPDLNLDVMQPDQNATELLARLLLALNAAVQEHQPDLVLVQGDTTSVFAAALAGFMNNITVAHVEAGLRTRDRRQPFPEELNRRLTGLTADWHFAPTQGAVDHLLREGVPSEHVVLTGNTVVDALRWMRMQVADEPLPAQLDPGGRRLVLVTAHRRENFGPPLERICAALRALAERFPETMLLYPVHPNPNVQRPVQALLRDVDNLILTAPLRYRVLVNVLSRAQLVITDSGGLQEEAPVLGKPVLVLREKTERPEAVAAGTVELVGTDPDRIIAAATKLLRDPAALAARSRPLEIYGDGLAAQRIVEVLLDGALTTPPFRGRW